MMRLYENKFSIAMAQKDQLWVLKADMQTAVASFKAKYIHLINSKNKNR